ncbi:protein prenyltransferase alpha subunit repeat-containing protein 1 [Crotalus adamanteus]|uniref:Protein prenyltransferase alpha subunit repeat-containing protein 1 n=1 Tax=Crotalus adamanteus TaxID=8729 RepID=A0AAW1C357_CROAD
MAESPEEVAVLVQRVVKDINSAFKRNPDIDEIGLIPCPEARYNRSPIVLVENKLGVESWCVKFLLPYVHNKLLHYKLRKQWLNKEELIDITCTLLLLNPDFTTAWNVRKELILSGTLNPIKDLHLGKLALTKFPKSPETWIHRRWVLQHLIQENSLPALVTKGNLEALPTEKIQRLVKEEMDVCCDAAGRYPSNYNAWSHRIWVLQNLAKLNTKILLDELSSTKRWVSMHVSDHSGFHYHEADEGAEAFCMEKQQPDHSLYLKEEIGLCTDLIDTYPGHETLWYHRRQVFYLQNHLKKCPVPSICLRTRLLRFLGAGLSEAPLGRAEGLVATPESRGSLGGGLKEAREAGAERGAVADGCRAKPRRSEKRRRKMVEREAGLAAEGKAASQVSCLPLRCCRRRRSRHPHPSQSRCGCCASRVALAQRRGEEGREKAEAPCLRGGWGGMPRAPCSRGSRKIARFAEAGGRARGAESSPATYRASGPGWAEEVHAPHCVSSNLCERVESLSTKSPLPPPSASSVKPPGLLFPSFPT